MKKRMIGLFLIIMFFVITGCNQKKEEPNNEVTDFMKVMINEKEYTVTLEDNETTGSFLTFLPLEFDMQELNGNEKYVHMNFQLPTNSYHPKQIEKGDIMLFGNNCLVIFYQSFTTNYSYTKIGHIDDLEDLGNENVVVLFEKN